MSYHHLTIAEREVIEKLIKEGGLLCLQDHFHQNLPTHRGLASSSGAIRRDLRRRSRAPGPRRFPACRTEEIRVCSRAGQGTMHRMPRCSRSG